MAKSRSCPYCGYHMYASREVFQDEGTWVYYDCRSQKCDTCMKATGSSKYTMTEKVFEDSSK